jgi:hypothetical protein
MPLSLFADEAAQPPATLVADDLATRREPLPWASQESDGLTAPPTAPGLAERSRRTALRVVLGLGAGAALAAYPWAALSVLLVAVWLLRTGSIAASRVGERRRARGARWYDGPRLVLGAPWDLLRSAPATVLLGLWAFGLAVAAMLVCYAVAASPAATLAAAGPVLVAGLWWGPGGGRLRSPVNRVVAPLSRRVRTWLLALAVAVLVAGLCWGLALRGADWMPFDGPPFSALGD